MRSSLSSCLNAFIILVFSMLLIQSCNPYYAFQLNNKGVVKIQEGDIQGAILDFEKAIEVDPMHEPSRFNKGIVLMHDLNDIKGAIAAWEGLLKINPVALAPNGQSVDQMVVSMKQQVGKE